MLSQLFRFFSPSMTLSFVAGVEFFQSHFFLKYSFFLSWRKIFSGSLVRGGAGVFPLAVCESLGLDSFSLDFLAVEPWIYTLVEVFWNGQWPLGQRKSVSWIIILDFRPALASALTVLCTISLKLVNAQSCCSIFTLIKGLRLSQK